jgi:hypothetical protein
MLPIPIPDIDSVTIFSSDLLVALYFPQREVKLWKCFFVSNPLLLHLFAAAFQQLRETRTAQRRIGSGPYSVNDVSLLAPSSAVSLPLIPECSGTHISIIGFLLDD